MSNFIDKLYSNFNLFLILIPLGYSIYFYRKKGKFKEAIKDDTSFEDGYNLIVSEISGKDSLESENEALDSQITPGLGDVLKPNTNSTILYSTIILFFMKHKIFLFFCSFWVVFLIIANFL